MEYDRQEILSKINSAINTAKDTERHLSEKNSNIIEPLKISCENFQEKKEFNLIFLKELKIRNYFQYPKNIKNIILKKIMFINKTKKEDEKSFCRAGIFTLFLYNTSSLLKYIRTNISLTNDNEDIFYYSYSFSTAVHILLKNKQISEELFLDNLINKNNNLKEKILDIKKFLVENESIENVYNNWDKRFKDMPIAIYALLKNKEDYTQSIESLIKFNNREALFAYGLLYGLMYSEQKRL